jgi:hypothetical protein
MPRLLLHAQTEESIRRYHANPTHALSLVAGKGSGKGAVAHYLTARLLNIDIGKLAGHPYVKVIVPEKDKSSISIDAIRDLQQFTKLKLPDVNARRVIVIPDADAMLSEAQNALLKMLEEPPVNTFFVLTASNQQQLLPTIRSRVQAVEIRRPGRTASMQYFATLGFDAKDVQQAYLMSGGLVGLMHALLSDAEHPLKASAQTARQLLQSTQFERLCQVDTLAKQKTEAFQVFAVLGQMASAAIEHAHDNKIIARWHGVLQAAYDAENALLQNASAKLVLTNFMLKL